MRIPTTLLAISLVAAVPASAYTITLGAGSNLNITAFDGVETSDESGLNPGVVLPYFATATAFDSGSSVVTEYDLSNDGFLITMDHIRTGISGGASQSSGEVRFGVDQDTAYSASGSYSAFDTDGHNIRLTVHLRDYTLLPSPYFLFQSHQQSLSTPNESFILGETDGDFTNGMNGDLTGTLIAGHSYGFIYNLYIRSSSPISSTVSATGFIDLSFSAIPEPSTGLLLTLGLLGLGVHRHRTR